MKSLSITAIPLPLCVLVIVIASSTFFSSFLFAQETDGHTVQALTSPPQTFTTSSISQNSAPSAIVKKPFMVVNLTRESIKEIWQQSNIVVRVTLIVLILMSITTWYITALKLIQRYCWHKINHQLQNQSGNWIEKITQLPTTPYHQWLILAQAAAHQAQNNPRLDPDSWIANALNHEIERLNSRLRKGMTLLSTIGSTAPFVGLFGTVWSIYHALNAIGNAGQASIDTIAGPIGEALIMTAFGLAVAVPAVFCYNAISYAQRLLIEEVEQSIDQLHAELVMQV